MLALGMIFLLSCEVLYLQFFLWGDSRQGKIAGRNEVLNERVKRKETWESADILTWVGWEVPATNQGGCKVLKKAGLLQIKRVLESRWIHMPRKLDTPLRALKLQYILQHSPGIFSTSLFIYITIFSARSRQVGRERQILCIASKDKCIELKVPGNKSTRSSAQKGTNKKD